MTEYTNTRRGQSKESSTGLFSERWSIRLWLFIVALCFAVYWVLLHVFLHNDHPSSSFTGQHMPGKEHAMSTGLSRGAVLPSLPSSGGIKSVEDGEGEIITSGESTDVADSKRYRPHMDTMMHTSTGSKGPLAVVLLSVSDPNKGSEKTSTKETDQKKKNKPLPSSTITQVDVVDKSDRQAVYYMEDDEEEEDKDAEVVSKKPTPKKRPSAASSEPDGRVKSQGELSRERNYKKQRQNQKRFAAGKLFNHEPEWGYNNELPYIQVLNTPKIPLKKDRRVVFPELSFVKPSRDPSELPSGVLGMSRELVKANAVLQTHPLYQNTEWFDGSKRLEDTMQYIQQSTYCVEKPIFLGMATVGDDLYWQLIENFIYSAVKFNVSQCALVICVSDLNCMKMCENAYFPCYNYQEELRPLPSVMEQIARVKLYHVPKALTMGVSVFMLDLDVGFLSDPQHMLKAFYATPIVDVMVQVSVILSYR